MRQEIQNLREQRAKLIFDAQELLKAENLSPEDEVRFDGMISEADAMLGRIAREEWLLDAVRSVEKPVNNRIGIEGNPLEVRQDNQPGLENAEAFRSWMRYGMDGLTPEQRGLMAKAISSLPVEARDQAVGTGAAGGFLVPQEFFTQLEVALKAFGGMRIASTIIPTASGAALPMPTANDTSVVGSILGENIAASRQDVAFGQVSLGSYMYTSGIVAVSLQLLQDSAINVDSFVIERIAERIARIQNTHFTIGTGTGQPRGVVIDAFLGKTGTTGQTTSIIYDDLVDTLHSLDPAYRPKAKWMLHDQSLKIVKKLKDTTGRPLWMPGVALREPDTLLGYEYVINQYVATMAANAKSVLFGDFSRYYIRDVLGVQLLRLNERFADQLQVGFLAFARADGRLLDAGTKPIVYYANSAT